MNDLVLMSFCKYDYKNKCLEANCLIKGYMHLQFDRYCQVSLPLSCTNLPSHKLAVSSTAGTLNELKQEVYVKKTHTHKQKQSSRGWYGSAGGSIILYTSQGTYAGCGFDHICSGASQLVPWKSDHVTPLLKDSISSPYS